LSIAKELVGMHEGTLSVQSVLGQGSTFSFRVPKAGPTSREVAVHAASNEGRSILIVDDNPTTLETMKLALRPLGAVLVGTTDPRSALSMVRELRPDLVILDVLMPHITGLDLLRSLREGADTRHLPVLVTSALHESEHTARQLGANWLPRPWNNAHLTQLTMALLDEPAQRQVTTLQS
jgi:CheY-like chemotaxis protein